jgi:hypothetical protein
MAEEQATTQISEADSLKLEIAALRGQLKERDTAIAGLEKTMAEKDTGIAVMKQVAEDFKEKFAITGQALTQAVADYKELAVTANPGPVAEMIKGDSIQAVKESLLNAKALVERVKQEVGAENSRLRVPAGAPQRTPPDLSGLTPREKIKYGMEG